MRMANPPHPGELLRDIMGSTTVSALAKHLGVTRANLSMLLNGRSGVSAMMSLKLDEAFGTSEGFWLRLQNQDDLAKARKLKRTKIKLLQPSQKTKRQDLTKAA